MGRKSRKRQSASSPGEQPCGSSSSSPTARPEEKHNRSVEGTEETSESPIRSESFRSQDQPLAGARQAHDLSHASKNAKSQNGRPSPNPTVPPNSAQNIVHRPHTNAPIPHTSKGVEQVGAAGDTPESLAQEIMECFRTVSGTPFPTRPAKPSQNGKKISLIVNCYRVKIPSCIVYHYDVKVFPKDLDEQKKASGEKDKYRILRNKLNQKVMTEAFGTFSIFRNLRPVYDGQRIIYTKKPLDINNVYTNTVSVTENGRTKEYEVEIKFAREVNLYAFHAIYENHSNEVPLDVVMVIDVILRYGLTLHLTPIGHSFYIPPNEQCRDDQYVGEGKELWFGCHQSFRPAKSGSVLNLNKTATTFFTPMSVIDFIREYLNFDDRLLERGLNEKEIKMLTSELSTLSVCTDHLEYPREYRVLRVSREKPQDVVFTIDRDGQSVQQNVAEYFQQQYGIRLRYPNLPCLQAQPEQKRLFLPIEVCRIVEGQHYRKKFSSPKVIDWTATPPVNRFKDIATSLEKHIRHSEPWLKEFGITIDKKPLCVIGRVLDPPVMKFGEKPGAKSSVQPSCGSWDMRNQAFLIPAQVKKWAVLSLARRLRMPEVKDFAVYLQDQATKCKMAMSKDPIVILFNQQMTLAQNLQENLAWLKEKSVELVVIILEMKNNDYYQVKTIAETHVGIKTQCVLEKNVRRPNPSLIVNILLKINKKMGGTSMAIPKAERPKCLWVPTMVVSADVCHSSPGERRTPSVAAAVGSMDPYLMEYHPVVKVQDRDGRYSTKVIEIISQFEEMMVALLEEFGKRNKGRRPDRILVYRDGVSEGQFEQVRNHEISALHKACVTVGGETYKPLITFIIVDKRHHIRFMPQRKEDGAGRDGNIPPGTVIDTDIVHATYYDFFLCSQLGLRGTSRPTRYCILWDDSDFSPDELQKITYFFCHNSASCNKSTSTPAAARYADMLAGRTRQHLLGNEALDEIEIADLSAAQQAILVCPELQESMYFL